MDKVSRVIIDLTAELAGIETEIAAEAGKIEERILAVHREGQARLAPLYLRRAEILAIECLAGRRDRGTDTTSTVINEAPSEGASDRVHNTAPPPEPISIALCLRDLLMEKDGQGMPGSELRSRTVAITGRPMDSVAKGISRSRARGDILRGADGHWRLTRKGKEAAMKPD